MDERTKSSVERLTRALLLKNPAWPSGKARWIAERTYLPAKKTT